jgi:hypothetical protein
MKLLLVLASLAAFAASPLSAGNVFTARGTLPNPVAVVVPSVAQPPAVIAAQQHTVLTWRHYFRIRESQYIELAALAQAKGDTQSAGRLRTAASVQVVNRMIYADILDEPYNGELGSVDVMPKS